MLMSKTMIFKTFRVFSRPFSFFKRPEKLSDSSITKEQKVTVAYKKKSSSQVSVPCGRLHAHRSIKDPILSGIKSPAARLTSVPSKMMHPPELIEMAAQMGLDVQHFTASQQTHRDEFLVDDFHFDSEHVASCKGKPNHTGIHVEQIMSPLPIPNVDSSSHSEVPVPQYLLESGILHPERLPCWVRMLPGPGPVIDLGGREKGGLGCHPIDMDVDALGLGRAS
jgi:hypothetical protein